MRIDRVVTLGLRALGKRDDRFQSSAGEAWPSVCLRGLNGSGKTTYLEALAQLWLWFRRCTKHRSWIEPSPHPLLAESPLFAARFCGLPGPRRKAWLVWGRGKALDSFLAEEEKDQVFAWPGTPSWDPDFLEWWDGAFTRAEMGGQDLPNVVCIEAENKWIPSLKQDQLFQEASAPILPPVARYVPQAKGANHLEGLLGTLKLVDEQRFARLQEWITELFPGLSLVGFNEARRPIFRLTSSPRTLTVDLLSAGERSVLINLVMVVRWLGPGGILLLDEPELHQHPSLMRGSVAVLERLVTEHGGQMFVASHAAEVWDHFLPRGTLVDLEGRDAR